MAPTIQDDRHGIAAQAGRRSQVKRVEAYAAFILEAIADQADITLAELQTRLSAEHGVHFAIGTLWRFFKRRRITFKKRRRMLPSSNAQTSRRRARSGSTASSISIPTS